MSLYFNGDKQALLRTTNLPASFANFTICGFLKMLTAPPTGGDGYVVYAQSADISGTNYGENLYVAGSGVNSLRVSDNWGGNISPNIAAITAGGSAGANWYFFAFRGSAAGAGGMQGYLAPVSTTNSLSTQAITNSPGAGGFHEVRLADTPFALGEFGVTSWFFNGLLAHVCFYDRALTTTELLNQSRQATPISSTSLISYHAFSQSTVNANLAPTTGTGTFGIPANSPSVSSDMPVFGAAAPILSGSDTLPTTVTGTTVTELSFVGNATSTSTPQGYGALVTTVVAPPPPPPPVDPTPTPTPDPTPTPPATPEPENPDLTYAPILLGFYTDAQGYITMKQANATLDYGFDWTAWLNGDTIAGSVWAVETGLTKGAESISADRRSTSVFLSGGDVGSTYRVTNTVTTSTGRTDSRTFRCRVI